MIINISIAKELTLFPIYKIIAKQLLPLVISHSLITSRFISKFLLTVVGNWADAVPITSVVVALNSASRVDVERLSVKPAVEVGRRHKSPCTMRLIPKVDIIIDIIIK